MKLTRSRVNCVIAGSGSLDASLRKEIERSGLNGRVKLLGWISDPVELAAFYARCLAVFYGPYDEDYGYVSLEAFSSRKPVITTHDAGGVLEFVRDEETGFIVGADPGEIADRIDRLAGSAELCKRLGEAGHDSITGISWDAVIRRLVGECA